MASVMGFTPKGLALAMGFDSHSLRIKTLSQSRGASKGTGEENTTMPTDVIYIDDSGTKEYASNPAEYAGPRGKSRYFVFCGLLISVAEAGVLTNQIKQEKLSTFGTALVEIKSNWLRIPRERQNRYLDPHGIDDAALDQFVSNIYGLVKASDLKFIAAVVDKLHVQEDYPQPWYAPAIAYELVLQRVESDAKATTDVAVIIDDMSGATPKGNQYKLNLQRQHRRLKQIGGQLRPGTTFDHISAQRFVNSAISNMVQIADLAAYNVYRQFNQYGADWERPGIGNLGMYKYFEEISDKFRMDANGRVQGYGIAKFPLRTRVEWTVV